MKVHSRWSPTLPGWFRRFVCLWDSPWFAFSLALVIYNLLVLLDGKWGQPSELNYYNYLADALMHGQLSLRLIPHSTHDLVQFNNNFYPYWPPFPALVLMPFVAIWGVGFSDILLTTVIGAANVGLVAQLLRKANQRGLLALDSGQRGALVLFFAVGTVHLTLAPLGRVWFTGQLVGFLCLALAYLAAVSLEGWAAFLAAGVAMAGALATRNHLALAGIWPAVYLLRRSWPAGWRKLAREILVGLAPVVVTVVLLGIYNYARFGSVTDVGLAYHRMAALFQADFTRYGAFNIYYAPTNLYYQLVHYPFPITQKTLMGGSLFLLSPVFFGALWAFKEHWKGLDTGLLWLTVVAVYIPIALLMGTGWIQFGPRYTLDLTVPLLLLTAMGIKNWPRWLLGVLVGISFVQYITGTLFLISFL